MIPTDKCFIIAELSANHNGSKEVAIETIRAAKRTGADAIKFQTYTADTITLDSKKEDFKLKQGTIWDGMFLHDLYQQAYTPWEWFKDLYTIAREEGLVVFSSPFDKSAVDLLESLDNPIYKIASFEITDIPLIEYAAKTMKPIIISTGIATDEDIQLAVNTCRNVGNKDITLLKCTSSYPAPIEEANLVMIKDLKERFNVKAGLSDHTMGIITPIVAVTLGATVIEKHFILNKKIGGPDASFSLDETEFTEMVSAVRAAEKANGKISYHLTDKMKSGREFSRSLYITSDVKKGDILTEKNVRSIRPGFGLHPKYYREILGAKFNNDFEKGTALKKEHFE
ncbi:pseudaminic acid synthase [Tenacibaculum haliotis]|uniref:pseudaminic acid synthase n=1 Tax=Tenacibaculum haliotis TaxID=1888914 RepID=UPI0021B07FB9|nr:pseudaminic acid synthase [Tenacibaculum haliotis]MCT4698886.1 pseudaminic acid synthase [Tenacibaculum haliotis]